MATYKSSAGAILQPGNQTKNLSGYNDEGVFGWPGVEAFELIGFAKVSNLAADKANFKSFSLTVPSPDRRPDDRVRDDRTSLVVQASSDRPAYVYGASIALAALFLIIPGFFTDTVGFLLLVPFTRKILFSFFIKKKKPSSNQDDINTLDGEIIFEKEEIITELLSNMLENYFVKQTSN